MTKPSPTKLEPSPDKDSQSILKNIPPWRMAWIGIGLAALLWFGSSIYFQKKHQFSAIDYQAGDINTSQYDATIRQNARYSIACKIGAGVLCLASFLFLISQADVHRPHSNT